MPCVELASRHRRVDKSRRPLRHIHEHNQRCFTASGDHVIGFLNDLHIGKHGLLVARRIMHLEQFYDRLILMS
eukprot:707682-Karenia_brevis.AAC.1